MPKRRILFGLGAGIIAACAVFFILYNISLAGFDEKLEKEKALAVEKYIADNPAASPGEKIIERDVTDGEIIERAARLGMVFPSAEPDFAEGNPEINIPPLPEPTETENPAEPEANNTPAPPAATASYTVLDDGAVKVKIPEGATATDIARILEDAGVISDAKGFRHYLSEMGYTTVMAYGTFTLVPGTDFAELAYTLKRK